MTNYNYTSHYTRQSTIGCQYHLYKENYTAVKEIDNKNKRINIKVQKSEGKQFRVSPRFISATKYKICAPDSYIYDFR